MFDIEELFLKTIEELKKGSRPRYKFSEEEVLEICQSWEKSFHDEPKLLQILCLIDHSHGDSQHYEKVIIRTLKEHNSDTILIHTMGISHRQVLNRRLRLSERIPFDYIKCFEGLLDNKNPEVLEWVLRTIEQMGTQSVILKEKVLKHKPGIKRLFNQHLKNGHEIIEMLEQRWK